MKETERALKRRLATSVYAPAHYRVIASTMNTPEFAQAFHCAVGTPMHPRAACDVW